METVDYTELLETIIANQEVMIQSYNDMIARLDLLLEQGITNIGYLHWIVVGIGIMVAWYLLYKVLKWFTQI